MNHTDRDKDLAWQHLDSELIARTRIFSINQHKRRNPENRISEVITVDPPDWVTIIPELPVLFPDKSPEILLVRQYRHGSNQISLEFPAGMIEPDEEPSHAAARELLEETGYRAENLVQIAAVNPNPAFMTNTNYTFLAEGLKKIQEQDLDGNEFIQIHRESVDKLVELMGKGAYNSAITVQAWNFYLQLGTRGQN